MRLTTREYVFFALLGALLAALLLASPASAQVPNGKATVTAALAAYVGLPAPLRSYCAVNRTAWELRLAGAGLYFKSGGTNVAERSIDILQFLPRGETFDVIRDADGTHPSAAWGRTTPSGFGPVARWRAPTDPALLVACTKSGGPSTSPVVTCPPPVCPVPPLPPPCPTCPPDLSGTVARLHEDLAALEDARAALAAKLAAVTCRASLFGVRVPCTVVR